MTARTRIAVVGMTMVLLTGVIGATVGLALPIRAHAETAGVLSGADVQLIIAQAVGRAQQIGQPATIAVVDREGSVLGSFQMTGARTDVTIGLPGGSPDPDGLENVAVPAGAAVAAVSKAGTAAYLSTGGTAFSTRTFGFIVQENIPPRVTSSQPGGDLFGVQFSNLPCSDVAFGPLPLGLSGDPGGMPIYKNGVAVGGIGVEIDGRYDLDVNRSDNDQDAEEDVARSGARNDAPPAAIRADQILIDGMRLDYANAPEMAAPVPAFADLPGTLLSPVLPTQPSHYVSVLLGGLAGKADPRYVPSRGSAAGLSAAEVDAILTRASQRASQTRSAIRLPVAQPTEVNIAVVDTKGAVLGQFSTQDAPQFGFDVSAQRARTAVFFSGAAASDSLRAAWPGAAAYADAAATDGIKLDGSIALSTLSIGELSAPSYAQGDAPPGPFVLSATAFSPFNTGLASALTRQAFIDGANRRPTAGCTPVPGLHNGVQASSGGLPLYRDGVLVGAIGISGDGIEQDDAIAAAGAFGFEAPPAIRADHVTVRGVPLPYSIFG